MHVIKTMVLFRPFEQLLNGESGCVSSYVVMLLPGLHKAILCLGSVVLAQNVPGKIR